MNEQFINISWVSNLASLAAEGVSYNLTISHGSSSDSRLISLNESTYHFTVPEGAPPCEVYNFSVTATNVGTTYTGCSVPSPVLSTMLPSLPDIRSLSDGISYHLVKLSRELTLISVYFEVRNM